MMFSVAWLRETAKRTNFIKRERKIQPEVFFWVISLGYGVSLIRTLAGMKRIMAVRPLIRMLIGRDSETIYGLNR
jgi:hypothetical protein